MQTLNKEQEKAVKMTEGYIRVISGAGTGKTRIITNRYVYLVNELGIANENILCITFTNNASKEMKQRINKMVKDKDIGYICTFHGLAVRALKEDIHCVGIVPNFTILDKEDQSTIFKKLYKKLGITNREYHYQEMKEYISIMKSKQESITNSKETIDYINYLGGLKKEPVISSSNIKDKFFNEYIEEQRKLSMLDYNDLLNIYLYILVNFKEKREKWQQRFQYIMCDEFNDIDYKQYKMLKILSQYHKNLLIVGDPDQTIYSWRGSAVQYILNFQDDFENCKDIIVNNNYRSVPSILNVANSLIEHNQNRIPKKLIPTRAENEKVIYNNSVLPRDESKWIVEQIENLIQNGEKLNDIAILYRNNKISRIIEEQLIEKKINYFIYNGIDFYSRKEIKDILSYLRFITYEKDIDFQRIINSPARGVGNKTMEQLSEYAEINKCTLYQALKATAKGNKLKQFINLVEELKTKYIKMSIIDLTNEILKRTGYQEELEKHNEQERIENIEELKHGILEYQNLDFEEKTLGEYLSKISLYTDIDRIPKDNAVKLMTVHGSKGLEFKNVFICRINEGIMPSGKIKIEEELEEERRLFYVAITRAKDKLFLSDIQREYNDLEVSISRFLQEIDINELHFLNEKSKERITGKQNNGTNNSFNKLKKMELNVGDKIVHSIFGKGVIESVNYEKQFYSIKFEDVNTIRNISVHIKLEMVQDDEGPFQ